jgi:hypothetical protein
MKNPVRFNYRLNGTGKAAGSFSLRDNSIEFQLSNVSNPLSDLLNGISGLILEPSHIWGDDNVAWVEWYNSESSLRWMLSTTDGVHLNIMMTETPDIFDDTKSKLVMDGECTIDHFIEAVVIALDQLLKSTGLLNYIQVWQKDEFPVTTFLFLKKHLIDKGLWQPMLVDADTLKQETELLLN